MTSSETRRHLVCRSEIVTAAGQSIGRAIAERLTAEGAEVHASDRDADMLPGLAAASTSALLPMGL